MMMEHSESDTTFKGAERRHRRSTQVATALQYQLTTCAERSGLSSMVLADHDGLVLATSDLPMEQSEEIAALLPMLAQSSDFSGLLMGTQAPGAQVVVSSFHVAGSYLFLCAVGDYSKQAHKEIAKAKVGVRRILN